MPEKDKDSKTICRHLRSRNSFGMMEGGGNPWHDIEDPNAVFWCNLTSGPFGPDNKICDTRRCKPGRKCFKQP